MVAKAGTAYVELVPRVSPTATQAVEAQGAAMGQRMAQGFAGAGSKFTEIGKSLTTKLTLPIVAGIGVAVIAADGLQGKLREVVSLTGLTGQAAEEAFGTFQKQVRDLSGELGLAQQELAGGLYQALSAGVPKENTLAFLEVAGRAAVAGVTDVETSVDGLTTILNAFGLKSDQVGAVADSMFTTVKGGKTTFAELSDALFQVAPIAAGVGVGFGEVNASLATLTSAGVPTSVAATQVRAALSGLLRPSEELTTIFNEAGYASAQAALEAGGLSEAFGIVADATDGDIGALQGLVGSIEGVQAIQTLTGPGAEKFAKELDAQATAAGATNTAFAEIDKSRSLERFKTSLANLGIAVGNVVLPVLRDLTDFLTPLVDKFQNLPDVTQKIIVGIGLLVAALGPLNFVIGTILKSLGLLVAHPIVALVVALAAAFIYAYFNIEPFREAVDKVVDAVIEFGQAAYKWFIEVALPAIQDFAEKVRHYFEDVIIPAAQAVARWFMEELAPQIAAAFDRVKEALGSVVTYVTDNWEDIKQAVLNAANIVIGYYKAWFTVIEAAWRTFGDNIIGILKAVIDFAARQFQAFIQVLQGVIDVIVGIFTLDWERVWNGIKQIFGGIWDGIVSYVDLSFDLIWEIVSGAVTILAGILDTAWATIKTAAQNAWDAFYELVTSAPKRIAEFIVNWSLPGILANHWREILEGARRTVESIVGFWLGLPGRLSALAGDILEAGKDIGGAILDGIGEAFGAAVDFAGNLASDIGNALVDWINDNVIDAVNSAIPNSIGWGPASIDLPDNPIPRLPRFHQGGLVTGPLGADIFAVLQVGETVVARDGTVEGTPVGVGAGMTNNFYGVKDGRGAIEELGWRQFTRGV